MSSIDSIERLRDAEARGRRRGHWEAADYLERVATEWSATEGGARVVGALRLEARNLRRLYLDGCIREGDPER